MQPSEYASRLRLEIYGNIWSIANLHCPNAFDDIFAETSELILTNISKKNFLYFSNANKEIQFFNLLSLENEKHDRVR